MISSEIEITMLWGDALLEVLRFGDGQQALIGRDAANHFQLDDASVGSSSVLAHCSDGACTLSIPEVARVVWQRQGATRTREEIAASSELIAGDRVRLDIGSLSLIARWVPAQAHVFAAPHARDYRFAKIVTTSVMTCAAVVAAIFMTDTNAFALSDDVFKGVEHWHIIVKAPTKDHKRPLELPSKKEQPTPVEKFTQTHADQKPGILDPFKKQRDHDKVMHAGLLDLLGGANGARSNVFSSGSIGTRLDEALGALKGGNSPVVDAGGMGGMGTRGPGPGGGGDLGLSGVGTRDGGRGGGPGRNNFIATLDDGRKRQTAVLPIRTTVVGGCERSVIARTIARHMNEVRFCYETQLNISQSLAGKVAVSFTIDTTGAVSQADVAQTTLNDNTVEQCILSRVRRWRFPEPKGGVCVINYPWVFHPAGAADDGAE